MGRDELPVGHLGTVTVESTGCLDVQGVLTNGSAANSIAHDRRWRGSTIEGWLDNFGADFYDRAKRLGGQLWLADQRKQRIADQQRLDDGGGRRANNQRRIDHQLVPARSRSKTRANWTAAARSRMPVSSTTRAPSATSADDEQRPACRRGGRPLQRRALLASEQLRRDQRGKLRRNGCRRTGTISNIGLLQISGVLTVNDGMSNGGLVTVYGTLTIESDVLLTDGGGGSRPPAQAARSKLPAAPRRQSRRDVAFLRA